MMRSYFFDRDHRIRFRVWGRRRRTSVIRLAPWLPTWPVKKGAHRVPAVGRVHRSSAPAPVRGALGSPRRLRGSLRRSFRGLETMTASRSHPDRSPTLTSPLITDFVSRCFRRLAIYIRSRVVQDKAGAFSRARKSQMTLSQQIGPYLPYLRRYARALTGSQKIGDAFVAQTLEVIVEEPASFPKQHGVRAGLYRLFSALWSTV